MRPYFLRAVPVLAASLAIAAVIVIGIGGGYLLACLFAGEWI